MRELGDRPTGLCAELCAELIEFTRNELFVSPRSFDCATSVRHWLGYVHYPDSSCSSRAVAPRLEPLVEMAPAVRPSRPRAPRRLRAKLRPQSSRPQARRRPPRDRAPAWLMGLRAGQRRDSCRRSSALSMDTPGSRSQTRFSSRMWTAMVSMSFGGASQPSSPGCSRVLAATLLKTSSSQGPRSGLSSRRIQSRSRTSMAMDMTISFEPGWALSSIGVASLARRSPKRSCRLRRRDQLQGSMSTLMATGTMTA